MNILYLIKALKYLSLLSLHTNPRKTERMSALQLQTIELIVWWYIRNHFEHEKTAGNVPDALKYLIKDFSMNVFNSAILTRFQDLQL